MATRTRTTKRKDNKAMQSPDDLLTMPEAAARLRVSMRTLQEWVQDKLIPHIRLGPKAIRFEPADIVAHKAKCRIEAAKAAPPPAPAA